jgi:hypothetical protein
VSASGKNSGLLHNDVNEGKRFVPLDFWLAADISLRCAGPSFQEMKMTLLFFVTRSLRER